MKILLVEDDLEISKLLVEFLQENGYEVFCQYDGLHVLDCLRENKIDLILLDIMLPYRNGDTVLTAVRETRRFISRQKVAVFHKRIVRL